MLENATLPLFVCKFPDVEDILPLTLSLFAGSVVPIPTLPPDAIRMRSVDIDRSVSLTPCPKIIDEVTSAPITKVEGIEAAACIPIKPVPLDAWPIWIPTLFPAETPKCSKFWGLVVPIPTLAPSAYNTPLLIFNDPLALTLPVNWWVLEVNVPNLVDPVMKFWDDVITCTTNVCAVIVPLELILPEILSEPVIVWLPTNVLLPVVANEAVLFVSDWV